MGTVWAECLQRPAPARSRTSRLGSPDAAFMTSSMRPAQGKVPTADRTIPPYAPYHGLQRIPAGQHGVFCCRLILQTLPSLLMCGAGVTVSSNKGILNQDYALLCRHSCIGRNTLAYRGVAFILLLAYLS